MELCSLGETVSLLMFATSVSKSSYYLFPFGRLNEAKLLVFVVSMAAKWGSWGNSLVFLKPHFGALPAVLAPLLPGDALSAPICVWQSLLHGFFVWLVASEDRMLEPEHFQFVWRFLASCRSLPFVCLLSCCFSLLSLGRSRGSS